MKSFLFSFIIAAVISGASSAWWEYIYPPCLLPQRCFDGYGCFSNNEPFNNALCKRPESPDEIGLKLKVFKSPDDVPDIPHITDCRTAKDCPINLQKKTTFIIHGFTDSTDSDWSNDIKDALLKKEDMTVVLVDWRRGAENPYSQAAANTRIVAKMVAVFINDTSKIGLDLRNIYCIGHSLGAHTCGQIGSNLGGRIGRITGLDAAGPYFDNRDPIIRLDHSDAIFVDTIHTDAEHVTSLGFGMMLRMGDADFYPQGGFEQEYCPKNVFQTLTSLLDGFSAFKSDVACSHNRAPLYYLSSINQCDYWSAQCYSYDDYIYGWCMCWGDKDNCNQMGYHADPNKHGIFYVYATGKAPYCALW